MLWNLAQRSLQSCKLRADASMDSMDGLFVQHIPQMLDWIEIWGIWMPSQHLKLCCVPHSWTIFAFTFSHTLVRVKVTSTWMAGPKVPLAEHCPKHHTASVGFRSSQYILVPCVSQGKLRTRSQPSIWCKRKHDSSDQATFFHCSVVQFWCSHAHCCQFRGWTG